MKRITLLSLMASLITAIAVYGQATDRLVSSKTHVKFFSSTPAEDIAANNYASAGTISKETGDIAFSVPMQGFEFEKALMQKHFNSEKFLNTQAYPKARLKGKITNIDEINFLKDGTYPATVEGDLTIKDITRSIREKGTVTVKGKVVEVESKFNVTLADYGISLVEGKPSTNVAKTVEVTVLSEYNPE